MFGRRTNTDFDSEALELRASTIKTREEFSLFAALLSKNFRKHRRDWENDTLDRYLDAIAAFSEDFDGYVKNTGSKDEENPWRLLATVLMAAIVYE